MALNPNIAMSFQAPKLESPVNMMAQMQQLQGAQQVNQLRAAQMQQMQETQQNENALAQQMQGGVRDPQELLRFGAPGRAAYESVLKGRVDERKAQAEGVKLDAAQLALSRSLLPKVTDQNTFSAWRADAVSRMPSLEGLIPQEYSPNIARQLAMTADQYLAQAADAEKIQAVAPNSTLIRGGQVIGQAPPAPETATAAMREYQTAVAQGFRGSFLDYQTRLRAAGASRTTVNLPPYQKAFAQKMGGKDAERVTSMLENAASAQARLVQIDRMGTALESGRFTPGIFGAQRQFLSQASEFLGLDASRLVDGQGRPLLGDAATADTIDAASKEIASEFAKNVGRVTNMSLGFIRDALPNLSRTPEGNAILIDVMRRAAQRELELGALADQYARIGDTRPQGMPSLFDAQAELEKRDPVISPELRRRIEQGSRATPRPPAGQTPAGAATGRADAQPRRIASDAEYNALPSGAVFIAPDGSRRRKP
jgi:hypothetical protein